MTQKHRISFIVSIHQPNIEVLGMFDNLYVLSKGGVNVYSGPPQSLPQHLNDCQINCKENEIPIEKLLKICANNCKHQSIIELKNATLIVQELYEEEVTKQMDIIWNMNSNQHAKFSLSSTWCLFQRIILLYYHTLYVFLLFLIFMFTAIAFNLLSIFQYKPSHYRDCQFINSSDICTDFIEKISDFKNVKYEQNFFFGITVSPFILIGFWTSLVMSTHINVFFWEHKNGEKFP